MRILLASEVFAPAVGGVETMALMLANEFALLGHEVVLVTNTLSADKDIYPFRVLRRPRKSELLHQLSWCEVFFQNNISLRSLWPLLLIKRPWVVVHHTWIRRADGSLAWQDHLKRYLLRFASGIAVSQAVADDISIPSTVIRNPYANDQFRVMTDVERDRDIVFLGRMVSDKGPDLLLHALYNLKRDGYVPKTTFIGAGPELEVLKRQAEVWGIDGQVHFAGQIKGDALVRMLNRHSILVVPSRWNEPFGLVALEGIACGCAVVGSAGGGLSEAIGPCGVTFENGNVDDLMVELRKLLSSTQAIQALTQKAQKHLAEHSIEFVANRYLAVMTAAVEK